jgi:hypothetical protein
MKGIDLVSEWPSTPPMISQPVPFSDAEVCSYAKTSEWILSPLDQNWFDDVLEKKGLLSRLNIDIDIFSLPTQSSTPLISSQLIVTAPQSRVVSTPRSLPTCETQLMVGSLVFLNIDATSNALILGQVLSLEDESIVVHPAQLFSNNRNEIKVDFSQQSSSSHLKSHVEFSGFTLTTKNTLRQQTLKMIKKKGLQLTLTPNLPPPSPRTPSSSSFSVPQSPSPSPTPYANHPSPLGPTYPLFSPTPSLSIPFSPLH